MFKSAYGPVVSRMVEAGLALMAKRPTAEFRFVARAPEERLRMDIGPANVDATNLVAAMTATGGGPVDIMAALQDINDQLSGMNRTSTISEGVLVFRPVGAVA